MPKPAVLTALAIGDALGAPLETFPWYAKEIAAWDGRYHASAYHGCAAGESTDDAGMAQALAESLLEQGKYDPESAMKHYLQWFNGNPKGMGGTIRRAMEAYKYGAAFDVCGVEGATGTGTVMRCAPFGLFFQENPLEDIAEIARVDADVTHRSDDARESSAFVSMMVAGILAHANPVMAYHHALSRIKDGNLRNQLRVLNAHVIAKQARPIQLGSADAYNPNRILGPELISGGAAETTVIATGALLLTSSFEDCLYAAIRAGGDTDTQAAIAGGMAGALYGFEGIPKWMLEGLMGWQTFAALDAKLDE